jgi:hypothetical protein
MSLQKEKTYYSEDYLDFIKAQPCIIEHDEPCRGDIVAHHTASGGVGMKGSDLSTIPLCDIPHNEVWHGPGGGKLTFEGKYNVDTWRLVQRMNWAYIIYLEERS